MRDRQIQQLKMKLSKPAVLTESTTHETAPTIGEVVMSDTISPQQLINQIRLERGIGVEVCLYILDR